MIGNYLKFLCLLQFLLSGELTAIKAVFIKPVSHLCSEQLSTYGLDNLEHYYNNQPLSGDTSKFDCMRTAQALFNEWCEVVHWDERTHEVGVQFSHFLVDNQGKLEPAIFWTLDSNLLIHSEKHEKFFTEFFPQPVTYADPKTLHICNHIVLIQPFFDKKSNMHYSAGTRFTRIPEHDTNNLFAISCYEPETGTFVQREVPVEYAWACDTTYKDQERRQVYVALLKSWCSTSWGVSEKNKRIIPYVWGGSSFLATIKNEGFEKVEDAFAGKKISYWQRPNAKPPVYGFDCSGLVMRVAQICGIPYWFKTTATALRHGVEIKNYQDMQNGDLIVWNGHMVIVSDKEKGLLIESVGYGTGYGRLHEARLAERFGNVRSYKDLFLVKEKQEELVILCKNGVVYKKVPEFKVISLMG